MTRSFLSKIARHISAFGNFITHNVVRINHIGATIVVLGVLLGGLTACSDSNNPTAPVIEKAVPAMEVAVKIVKAGFPLGVGAAVGPGNSETFGLNFGYEGSSVAADAGTDGRFEMMFIMGEHQLWWHSPEGDSLSRVTFSGRIAPRAVANPSISFGEKAKVVADVSSADIYCDFGSCWLQRTNSVFAGSLPSLPSLSGRFQAVASATKPYAPVVVRAGAVLSGVCDPKNLNKYMVVEGKSLLAQYQNVDVQRTGTAQNIGDFYLEVSCRLATTPAYARTSSVKSVWD